MRKLVSGTFIVLFMAAGLTSCKKDWTCDCTSSAEGISVTTSHTINGTKKDAKTACDNLNTSTLVSKTTCAIK